MNRLRVLILAWAVAMIAIAVIAVILSKPAGAYYLVNEPEAVR